MIFSYFSVLFDKKIIYAPLMELGRIPLAYRIDAAHIFTTP